MLKILLVDDEPNVREGIKRIIPWEEYGFTVCGEGENGDEGLAKIMELNPDLVLADIKMPGMTGIELIGEANKRGFKGKFIIVSGYSDFSYAQAAISLGVEYFLLKPIDEDELIKVLTTVKDKILKEHDQSFHLEIGKEYINELFIKNLLLGESTTDLIKQGANLADYNFSQFTVALVSPVNERNVQEALHTMDEIAAFFENTSDADVVKMDIANITSVLFKGWQTPEIMNCLKELQRHMKTPLFITVGELVYYMSDITKSYRTSFMLMESKFFYSDTGILTAQAKEAIMNAPKEKLDCSKELYAYIDINDVEKLKTRMQRYKTALCQEEMPADRVKILCIRLLMDIKQNLVKGLGERKGGALIPESVIADIGEKASLSEIIDMMTELLIDISNENFGKTTKSTMERIVQYIQANYNQELRLDMLADIFGYNSAYLGKIFHQYTGENFNNYLDDIRITEAKRLLAMDEYKVYEVAEMVGFSNINYFHNKFKKNVGISPLSFKKNSTKKPKK